MKALLFDWSSAGKEILEEMGYKHLQELTITKKRDMYIFADELLDANLDVMIEKRESGEFSYQINVDRRGRRFRQR